MKLFVSFSQFLTYAKSLKGEEMIALEFAQGGYNVTTRITTVPMLDENREYIAGNIRRESPNEAQAGNAACFSRITKKADPLYATAQAEGSQRDTLAAVDSNLGSDGDKSPSNETNRATVTLTASLPISFSPIVQWLTKIAYKCPSCEYPCESGEPCFLCGKMQQIADKARANRRNCALEKRFG